MRVHATDQLFGLEAFSRPLDSPAERPAPDSSSTGISDQSPDRTSIPEGDELEAITSPVMTVRSLVGRGTVLGLLLFILIAAVGLSLFTLSMKTRKKAASYELAHQTRLFRRMSKHRAIYELEYAYLRSSSPILEEFTRQGWREVTPHDLIYIPVTKSVPRGRQELTW